MPSFGAFEALAIAKNEYADIPFIILSGTIGEETAVKAMLAGAHDYFLKDNLVRLASTLYRLLAEVEQTRQQNRRESILREAEELFRLLMDQVKDIAIITLDPTGTIVSWPVGPERFFGYTPPEAIGQNFAMLFTEDDRLNRIPENEIAKAKFEGKVENLGWRLTKSGALIYTDGVMNALYDKGGQLRGFAKILHDKTASFMEQKKHDKEREDLLSRERAARQEAERLNRVKDEFLAILSHELRTPLSAIIGYADLLLDADNGQPAIDQSNISEALQVIHRSAHAQLRLIDDLLDVSAIISGRFNLKIQEVSLTSIIATAVDTVRLAASSKGINIITNMDIEKANVRGDASRLQQIIWNLLSNAVKFTPGGGHIRVTLRGIQGAYEIEVQDTGKGIQPEFLPHVFDRFRQEDSSSTRHYSGLGLGLAIVRHLVELHGGQVYATSAGKDQGSTFVVSLPTRAIPMADRLPVRPASTTQPSTGGSNGNSLPLKGNHILFLDDNIDAHRLFQLTISRLGAKVTLAETGQEALSYLQKEKIDVFVSDIGLPGEDGYQIIKKWRQIEDASGRKPVIAVALTAFAGQSDSEQALRSGFNAHVAKPATSHTILNAIVKAQTHRDAVI